MSDHVEDRGLELIEVIDVDDGLLSVVADRENGVFASGDGLANKNPITAASQQLSQRVRKFWGFTCFI